MARKSRFRSKKGGAEALQQRTDKLVGRKGGKWKPIFLDSAKFEKWVCREGDHIIDIIPYLDNDDNFQYKLELLVHQKIGPDEGNFICPKTFGSNEECPLCSARSTALAEDNQALAKLLSHKERVIYNIVCYDSAKEEKKGVQVWEASSYLAEENFQAAAKKRIKGGGGGKVAFADPDNGRMISWERTGSGINTRYVGFAMEPRDEVISDDILDEAHILENLIDIPSIETLQEQADIVLGYSGESDPEEDSELDGTGEDVPLEKEEEPKPSRRPRTRRNPDPEPEESPKKPRVRRTRRR